MFLHSGKKQPWGGKSILISRIWFTKTNNFKEPQRSHVKSDSIRGSRNNRNSGTDTDILEDAVCQEQCQVLPLYQEHLLN